MKKHWTGKQAAFYSTLSPLARSFCERNYIDSKAALRHFLQRTGPSAIKKLPGIGKKTVDNLLQAAQPFEYDLKRLRRFEAKLKYVHDRREQIFKTIEPYIYRRKLEHAPMCVKVLKRFLMPGNVSPDIGSTVYLDKPLALFLIEQQIAEPASLTPA